MSKLKWTMVAALLGSGAAFAQSEDQGPAGMRTEMKGAAEQKISELRTAELKVKDVDRSKHKVTFEAQVSPEASFTKESGEPIKIDQLQKGDTIRAAFDPSTGDVVAVQVITPEGKKEMKMKEKEQEKQK